jgi:hypothetical protein
MAASGAQKGGKANEVPLGWVARLAAYFTGPEEVDNFKDFKLLQSVGWKDYHAKGELANECKRTAWRACDAAWWDPVTRCHVFPPLRRPSMYRLIETVEVHRSGLWWPRGLCFS